MAFSTIATTTVLTKLVNVLLSLATINFLLPQIADGNMLAGVDMKDLEEELFDRSPSLVFKTDPGELSEEEAEALSKKISEVEKSKMPGVSAWHRVYRLLFREIKTE